MLHFPQLSLPMMLPKWAASHFIQKDKISSLTHRVRHLHPPQLGLLAYFCVHILTKLIIQIYLTAHLEHTMFSDVCSLFTLHSFKTIFFSCQLMPNKTLLMLQIQCNQSLTHYQCASEFRHHKTRPTSPLHNNFLSLLVQPKLFDFQRPGTYSFCSDLFFKKLK